MIYGSGEVSNPFHIWALSAYVRYYTDFGAKGTSYGLAIEWMYHNIGDSFGMSGGAEVNFGKTIFSDFKNHNCISNFYFLIMMGVTELVTNPFTEEKFMLCYAVSDKTYNFVEMLFTPRDKRHTLLIK